MVKYPSDWNTTTLGFLGDVKMCKRIFQSQTRPFGQIPFYKIGTFGSTPDAYISRELFKTYKNLYSFPKKGDVMISAAGTIGRTVVYDGKDAYFQDSNIVWLDIDPDKVDRNFLMYFYQSYPWENLEGTTIRRLYNGIIRNTTIHLPPLPEQKAIANTLTAFDAHIANLSELIEKKKAIRDGALEDLVSGKMRVNNNPLEWQSLELDKIAYYSKERSTTVQRFYVSTENMRQEFSGIDSYDSTKLIQGISFSKGDILIANIRPYLKKIWYAEFEGACSADVLVLRCTENFDSKFLYYLIANDHYINYVMAGGIKGIKMPRGDKKYIMQYPILVPQDKKKQEKIAQMLTEMDNEITALEAERDKMISIREGAMDDLLTGRIRLKVS